MRRLLILGFTLTVLTAMGAAQETKHPVKHYQDRSKTEKSVVPAKPPASSTPEANLRRLEQQNVKAAAPARTKRASGAALLKADKQKPTPPINFSGSGGAKGPGTTAQGKNPYHGRLHQGHH